MMIRQRKLRFLFFFVLSLFLFNCHSPEADLSFTATIERTLRLEPGVGNPRNSEGDFIRLNDGRLLFIYTHFTGSASDHARAYLAGRFSADNGKTWTTADQMIVANEGQMNVMSVSLLRLQTGAIALFYLRKNSTSDCIPMLRISTDEAITWSEPVRCIADTGYYVLNNDRAVQLSSGRILLPVACHKTPDTDWSSTGRIWAYYSDDQGQTWQKSREVPNPRPIVLQEPGMIELKNGKLILFCRTNAGVQYVSYSEDQGTSWSPVEPSQIKSPLSPTSMERIPATGDLLLVWNANYEPEHADGGRRTPLTCAISKDEGQTWEKIRTLERNPNGWYCYTAIEFIGDDVLLGYCAGIRGEGRNGLETTVIVRIMVADLYE